MLITSSIPILRSAINKLKQQGRSIGFVPTMGALHEGHATLLRRSVRDNDATVLSIFVNPAQFSPQEDFRRYPRTQKKDVLLAKKTNVDIIFYPSVVGMYPAGFSTRVQVDGLSEGLCGALRPGHFRGVATVVAKLLNIVTPDVLYLGQKDAQQCAVIRRMVDDLNFPVRVQIEPTVRESDGLAMSSRNRYLTPNQRQKATGLYAALKAARAQIRAGERRASRIKALVREMLRRTSGRIDYVECVDAKNLKPCSSLQGDILIAVAVWFGRARLIDNIIVRIL
ncbi:MAG: pantoate--beta-alanine ligase [Candidatus Omnitrophota bacterium]|nr:pantoate--beta-alanine ligase [Candidatus Omnitrophota bacterium]MDZ4241196.1 pantoate--beta-alanine ligase [Candidatus Omnitrophota bacterium]